MHDLHVATRMVEIAVLGERLSALRLCEAESISAVRRSLERYGQLAAVTLFTERDGLQIIDGFKRVHAARALGWATLVARIDDVGAVDAKLRLRELHDRRGLTELESGPIKSWPIKSCPIKSWPIRSAASSPGPSGPPHQVGADQVLAHQVRPHQLRAHQPGFGSHRPAHC